MATAAAAGNSNECEGDAEITIEASQDGTFSAVITEKDGTLVSVMGQGPNAKTVLAQLLAGYTQQFGLIEATEETLPTTQFDSSAANEPFQGGPYSQRS